MSDDRKIQVDDDWKSQAAQEKARLAETAETGPAHGMPEASFAGLVQLIAMQALVGLGGFAGPAGQEIPPNLDLAKHHIDLLDMLDRKTSGNLQPDEKRVLDTTLHQLRMAYVEAVRGGVPMPPSGRAD
jgi:uncharacterized protein DUF1844